MKRSGVYFRLLTPPGEAAIAVFQLSGPECAAELADRFRPRGRSPVRSDDLRFGRFDFGDGITEDCVVRTYPEAAGIVAEVSIHGSVALIARAAATWAESPIKRSPASLESEASAFAGDAFADQQIRFFHAAPAALRRRVDAIRARLACDDTSGVRDDLSDLLAAAGLGLAFATPPVVVFTGAVNAGKSSLFNALLGEDRTIVSPTPGTTRDVVEERYVRRGLPFVLVDTAGLRDAVDPVEREGVLRAAAASRGAAVVVRIADAARSLAAQGFSPTSLRPGELVLVARDDLAKPGLAAAELSAAGIPFLRVSVAAGRGVDEAADAVVAVSAFGRGLRAAAPFTSRQTEALLSARTAAEAGDRSLVERALERFCGTTSAV